MRTLSSLRGGLQVWDVSQSVDSPQVALGNPAPHAFTCISVCPGFPVVAAGDSAGTVTVMRLNRPAAQAEAEEQQFDEGATEADPAQ